MNNKVRIAADLGLLIVAVVWGFGFVATKNALGHITPLYMIALRFSIAFFILSVVFWKKLKQINRQDLKAGGIVGFFLFTAFAFQTIGLQFTEAGKQAFLTGTNVVMVPFLYWLLHKTKPDWRSFAAAFVCVLGMGLLTLNSTLSVNIGDLLTLGCAVLFACHIVSNGYFVQKSDPILLTILQFGFVSIAALIAAFFAEPMPSTINSDGITAILYLGVFSTCLAFFLQTICQKYTLSTHAAILLSTESLFGSLFSVWLLAEVFTFKMILGCAAILLAILIAELKPSEASEPIQET